MQKRVQRVIWEHVAVDKQTKVLRALFKLPVELHRPLLQRVLVESQVLFSLQLLEQIFFIFRKILEVDNNDKKKVQLRVKLYQLLDQLTQVGGVLVGVNNLYHKVCRRSLILKCPQRFLYIEVIRKEVDLLVVDVLQCLQQKKVIQEVREAGNHVRNIFRKALELEQEIKQLLRKYELLVVFQQELLRVV